MSLYLDPTGTLLLGCRFRHPGFPKIVPWQSPHLSAEHSWLFLVLFLWQNYCKGAVCLAGCELPAARAGTPNPCWSHSLLAQYWIQLQRDPKFVLCTCALSQSMALLSLSQNIFYHQFPITRQVKFNEVLPRTQMCSRFTSKVND